MRLFFGIEIDNDVKDKIYAFVNSISTNKKELRWVKKDNLHITLQFIGEVEPDKVSKLKELSSKIKFPAFTVNISSLGGFPYLNNPRVLWLGIKKKYQYIKQTI